MCYMHNIYLVYGVKKHRYALFQMKFNKEVVNNGLSVISIEKEIYEKIAAAYPTYAEDRSTICGIFDVIEVTN